MSRRAPGERAPGPARDLLQRAGCVAARRLLAGAALLAAASLAASLAAASLAACARPSSERGGAPAGSIAALAEVESAPAIDAPSARSPGELSAPRAPSAGAVSAEDETTARLLERSPLRALRLTGKPADGRFEATLAIGAAEEGATPRQIKVKLAPAQKKHPLAFRRPVAFYRLARALGARVVPAAAARRIGIGELAALLGRDPGAKKLLRRFAVMNDGTVDALVLAPAPGPPGPRWTTSRRRTIRFDDDGPELKAWARWARAPSPARGERASILRDYLQVLTLDYLAGNGLRKEIVLDASAGALSLEANASAFPLHVRARELDRQIELLVEAARFPRALRDALARFRPEDAAAALRPGGIEDELVPPRALVELEERRQALLSLIEAKIAARGEAAVLSL